MKIEARRHSIQRIAIALIAAYPALGAWAQAPAPAAGHFNERAPVVVDDLERSRGGFLPQVGLEVSFGIDRAISINGQLVANTRLVFGNLEQLLRGGMPTLQVLGNAMNIIQNGPGNVAGAAAAVASGLAAGSGGVGAVLPALGLAPASAPGAPSTPTGASQSASVATVQTPTPPAGGVGNPSILVPTNVGGLTLMLPSSGAIAAAVQNTVNDQKIQARTQIDVSTSGMAALRSESFAASIRQQVNNALRP